MNGTTFDRQSTAALAGVAGCLIAGGVPLILGAVRPDYDAARDLVSLLSLGPGGWMNAAALVLGGLGIAAFGLFGAQSMGRWARRLVVTAGAGLTVAGLAPHDPGLHYPPDAEQTSTLVGAIHDVAGAVFFLALAATCFVVAWQARGTRARLARISAIAGGLTLGAWIATASALAMQYGGQAPDAPAGLLERIAMLAGLIWLGGMAVLAARRGSGQPSAPGQPMPAAST